MNARFFWHITVCALGLAACGPQATLGRAETLTFAAAKGLDDFELATAGGGSPGEWSIVRNEAAHALAQTGTDPTDSRFPLAIYRPFSGRNVYVSIRFMPVSGKIDQAGGVVVRFTSAGDYYVARANALENNVRFYRVVAGKREMIAGVDANVSSRAWHTLGIAARATASRYCSTAGNFLMQLTELSPV